MYCPLSQAVPGLVAKDVSGIPSGYWVPAGALSRFVPLGTVVRVAFLDTTMALLRHPCGSVRHQILILLIAQHLIFDSVDSQINCKEKQFIANSRNVAFWGAFLCLIHNDSSY